MNILDLMEKDCFQTMIDFDSSYLMVGIHPKYQKYLKFFWKGVSYMYVVMPFSLLPAPRIFTKLLKPPVSLLHLWGTIMNMYLDDSWQMDRDYKEYLYFTALVYNLFVQCGFLPNHTKSVLIPTQRLESLSFILDSRTMLITIGKDKCQNLIQLCVNLLTIRTCSICHLAKVMGKIISVLPALPLQSSQKM